MKRKLNKKLTKKTNNRKEILQMAETLIEAAKNVKIYQAEQAKERNVESLEKDLDIIYISYNKYLNQIVPKYIELRENNEYIFNYHPLIPEGLIKYNKGNLKHRLHFKHIYEKNITVMQVYTKMMDRDKDYLYIGEVGIITQEGKNFQVLIEEGSLRAKVINGKFYINSTYIDYYQTNYEQLMENPAIVSGIKMLNEDMTDIGMLFVAVVAYINYLLENPEIKEIETKNKSTTNVKSKTNSNASKNEIVETNTTTDNNAAKPRKPQVININNIKFVLNKADNSTGRILKGKKKYKATWGVRGHYRHYKSGKVSYVKPYTKGDKEKTNLDRIQKIYNIR